MSLYRKFVLAFAFLLATGSPALAQKCPASGFIEKLVEPAKMEDGFVKASSIRYNLSFEVLFHPAKYEIMTQAEYEALDEDMTYTTYEWKYAKYSKEPIEPATDIAKYDIILTPDGNQYHRPIEEKINAISIEFHRLVKPAYRAETIVSEKRPEPEPLRNGRVKVMISPKHSEPLGGKRNGYGEYWQHYVKTRTPATYQQVKCDKGT